MARLDEGEAPWQEAVSLKPQSATVRAEARLSVPCGRALELPRHAENGIVPAGPAVGGQATPADVHRQEWVRHLAPCA